MSPKPNRKFFKTTYAYERHSLTVNVSRVAQSPTLKIANYNFYFVNIEKLKYIPAENEVKGGAEILQR